MCVSRASRLQRNDDRSHHAQAEHRRWVNCLKRWKILSGLFQLSF